MQVFSKPLTNPSSVLGMQKPHKFQLMAFMCAAIGLASSALTGYFFVLGILRSEGDPYAQVALSASGVLLILAELAAFYAASRLPKAVLKEWRRGLLVFGVVLLMYEIYVMSFTQMLLLKNADLAASANTPRIELLQKEILRYQDSANLYRKNAELASAGGAITRSILLLDLAAKEDAKAAEGRKDLQLLEPKNVATTTDVLEDKSWILLNAVARSIAMSVSGLILFAFSGALYRETFKAQGQEHKGGGEEHYNASREHVEEHREHWGTLTENLGEPIEPQQEHRVEPGEHSTGSLNNGMEPREEPHLTTEDRRVPEKVMEADQDAVFVFEEHFNTPYPEVVEALRSGQIKPTIRDIKAFSKVGYAGAKKILDSLLESRVLVQEGREYFIV